MSSSCPFAFDLETAPRGTRSFIERKRPDRIGPEGLPDVQLLPGYNEFDPDGAPPFSAAAGDDEYDVSNAKALQTFVGRWVPMPFFALRPGRRPDGSPLFDQGPSNWARACLFPAEPAAPGHTHTLVLAFDTQLAPGPRGAAYDAPSREDAQNEREFALAHRFDDLGWFFRDERTDAASNSVSDYQEWLSAWLEGVFHDFIRAERPGRPFDRDSLDHRLEHVARYIAFVSFVERAVRPGSVRLVDTVSEEPFARPVAVDLVLDIGNSRTCGILIESHANEAQVDLGNSMVLQLRDLSRPDRTTSDPFESHVELAQANFGPESLSRRSGRARAFLWPSLVRVGPEAARLRAEAEGTERTSGLSSPKRYLWDTAAVPQPWSFQPGDYPDPDMPPLIQRAAARYLNPRGDVLSVVARDRKLYAGLTASKAELADIDGMLTRLTFSRSSFFTFMVGEVIVQALSMINSPDVRRTRAFADAPRRLNRLILTLPTAMPVREQRIMRSRVEGALSLIWDLMGWRGVKSSILEPPELIVAWDEASCVQFVYLYSEIARKSGGDAQDFFELAGRPRAFARSRASVRRSHTATLAAGRQRRHRRRHHRPDDHDLPRRGPRRDQAEPDVPRKLPRRRRRRAARRGGALRRARRRTPPRGLRPARAARPPRRTLWGQPRRHVRAGQAPAPAVRVRACSGRSASTSCSPSRTPGRTRVRARRNARRWRSSSQLAASPPCRTPWRPI